MKYKADKMKAKITKNYIYSLGYQIVLMISPLIVAPYVSRVLGAEAIGTYSYTQSIVTYFKLIASFGISLYAQVEIAYVQDNIKKRSKLFWEVILIRSITTLICFFAFVIFSYNTGDYRQFYIIQMIDFMAIMLDITWFYQGLENFKKIALINTVVKILEVIAIFIFVREPEDLWIYILCYSLALVIGSLSLWLFLKRDILFINLKLLEYKKHLRPILYLFFPQIATQIYTVLDKTMLGKITHQQVENGYYEQGQRIVRTILLAITAFGTVMTSRIAKEYAEDNQNNIIRYVYKSFQFILLLALPATVGIVSVADYFVPWFFGAGYEKVILIIRILSPIIIFIGFSNVLGMQFLVPRKRHKEFTVSVICAAIINVLINLFLIPRYQSIGTAIGTLIAEIIVVIVQFYLTRKDIKIIEVIMLGRNYYISSIVMAIVVYVVKVNMKASFTAMLLQIVSGIVTYCLMLIILKDDSIYFIKKTIRKEGNSNYDRD